MLRIFVTALVLTTGVWGLYSMDEERLMRDLLRDYSRNVMPDGQDNTTLYLEFGHTLIHMLLDESTGVANVFGWDRYQWNDPRLKWNPDDHNGIEDMRINNGMVWSPYPDWTLYNSLQVTSETMEKAMMVLYSSGNVLWIPRTKRQILCNPNADGSFDCMFKFGSWVHHGGHLMPTFYNGKAELDLEDYMERTPWEVTKNAAEIQLKKYDCCEEIYPSTIFNITVQRKEGYSSAPRLAAGFTITTLLLACVTLNF